VRREDLFDTLDFFWYIVYFLVTILRSSEVATMM
jgi:hypothetical protein